MSNQPTNGTTSLTTDDTTVDDRPKVTAVTVKVKPTS